MARPMPREAPVISHTFDDSVVPTEFLLCLVFAC
jgi:hypothetical protein